MCGKGKMKYSPVQEVKRERNPNTGKQEVKFQTLPPLGYANYSGTFFNDKFHGIGKQIYGTSIYAGEYKMGKRHGKATVYSRQSGGVYNTRYAHGSAITKLNKSKQTNEIWLTDITEKYRAWYGNGKAFKMVTKSTLQL